nr:ATP-binding protein [uncultured Olsenella sp.]
MEPDLLQVARAGIGSRFASARSERAAEMFGRMSANETSGAYVYGSVGCGKTHLASAVAIEAMRHWWRPTFVGAVSMLGEIRSGYERGSDARSVADFERSQLLVLDDLDKPRPTPWALETLYELLDCRYSNGSKTVVTANCSLAALYQRLAEADEVLAGAICDRLRDGTEQVMLSGESRRGWASDGHGHDRA